MALNNFDYPVVASDFTPRPARPTGEDEDAKIKVSSAITYRTRRHGNSITIMDANVNIVVTTIESWMVSSFLTDVNLLKHEQGHYDITAIGTREIYTELLLVTASTPNGLIANINAIKQRIQQKIDATNIRYDTATNHYLNRPTQLVWDQHIATVKTNPVGKLNDLP